MSIILRDYQLDAVRAVGESWRNGKVPVCVLPPGAGKSIVIAELFRRLLERDSNRRLLVLQHRKELIEQNVDKLLRLGVDCGIYSAGLGSKELHPVTVAGVQSIAKEEFLEFDAIAVDESHRVMPTDEGQYRAVIRACGNPRFIVGFTGSPWRLRSGCNSIIAGGELFFSEVVWGPKISELIEQGHLCPLVTKCSKAGKINCDNIEKKGGEFVAGAADKEVLFVLDQLVKDARERCVQRNKVMLFTPGIESAELAAFLLQEEGARVVSSKTDAAERKKTVEDFRAGKFKWLVNCMIFTEGFDVPDVDAIVLARPTQSATLYVQIVGRGLRPAEGKGDCLILDYAQNAERFGPLDRMDYFKVDGVKAGKRSYGICPECSSPLAYKDTVCPSCGYIRPTATAKADNQRYHEPYDGDLVKADEGKGAPFAAIDVQTIDVRSANVFPVVTSKGNPALRINYSTSHGNISEWVIVARSGQLGNRMQGFFNQWCGKGYYPTSEQDAANFLIRHAVREPAQLRARKKGDSKHWEILNVSKWRNIEGEVKVFSEAVSMVEQTFPGTKIDWSQRK